MWKTPIGRLRLVGMVEGLSFLILVGIAVPLKHLADMPMPVKVVGWVHGVLFMAFCAVLVQAQQAAEWAPSRMAKFFVAALLPFGPFVVDRGLKDEDAALQERSAG